MITVFSCFVSVLFYRSMSDVTLRPTVHIPLLLFFFVILPVLFYLSPFSFTLSFYFPSRIPSFPPSSSCSFPLSIHPPLSSSSSFLPFLPRSFLPYPFLPPFLLPTVVASFPYSFIHSLSYYLILSSAFPSFPSSTSFCLSFSLRACGRACGRAAFLALATGANSAASRRGHARLCAEAAAGVHGGRPQGLVLVLRFLLVSVVLPPLTLVLCRLVVPSLFLFRFRRFFFW